eukprot:Skav223771  [mRNA]  locus=scaffold521:89174:90139:- [translate_table: standard]
MMSPECLSSSTVSSAKALVGILGCESAEHKLAPMSNEAEVLGVVAKTKNFGKGTVQVAIKEPRRLEAVEAIKHILERQAVVPAELPSILGRIQFADGQLTGRSGKLALADIRALGLHSKECTSLDAVSTDAFHMLLKRFECNVPKSFKLTGDGPPILVFTDGSYEPSDKQPGKIGGVMLDPGRQPEAFGSVVPQEWMESWKAAGKEHLIGQIEMYAICVARNLWRKRLCGQRVIIFVDHWAVLDSYILGTSREPTWRKILLSIEEIDFHHPAQVWATRVPSESNIADPPSRGHLSALSFLGSIHVEIATCPMTKRQLMSCI